MNCKAYKILRNKAQDHLRCPTPQTLLHPRRCQSPVSNSEPETERYNRACLYVYIYIYIIYIYIYMYIHTYSV